MSRLPSLKGLQAFESAARTGSFASAASDLSVSPAAVSQLVRALEDQLGRKLFHRINRGIVLSEAGLEILPRVSAAFEELQAVGRQLSDSAPRARLTVSVPPSVATGWLSARIARFAESYGPNDISIRGEEDPVALDRDLIDIRLSYGRLYHQANETEEIVTDAVHPVCAPAFLARHGPFKSAAQLLDVPLIHTDWGPSAPTFPSWRRWFEAAGVAPDHRAERGTTANSSKVATDLAVNGLGVALIQGLFASDPMAAGSLVPAIDRSLILDQPYCLAIPQRRAQSPVVSAFRQWLVGEVADAVAQAKVSSG